MDIDTRTDVYALGVILYELLAGSPPLDAKQFKRGAILEMLRMVREVDPPRPSTKVSTADALPSIAANRDIEPAHLKRALRGDLDWIVMKALEKDRTRRYETANGFAADILRHLAYEPVLAAPPSRAYRLRKFVRKHRGAVIAASLVLLRCWRASRGRPGACSRPAFGQADAWPSSTPRRRRPWPRRTRRRPWRPPRRRRRRRRTVGRGRGEKECPREAQKRLAQIEKGDAILTSVFDDLDIRRVKAWHGAAGGGPGAAPGEGGRANWKATRSATRCWWPGLQDQARPVAARTWAMSPERPIRCSSKARATLFARRTAGPTTPTRSPA